MSSIFNQVYRKNYISALLILFSLLTYNNIMSLNAEPMAEFAKNSGLFAIDIYKTIAASTPNENIVFSPFSIQTCVAMARMGAEGETAKEMERGLHLVSSDTTSIADSFSTVLAKYLNSNILKIANKIYFMKGFTVRNEFNQILTKKFYSTAEAIDFANGAAAADNINHWVESKTNHRIKKLISSDSLTADTRLVLLNAIYFKGTWKIKFNKSNTQDEDFYLNDSDSVKVPMMNVKAKFRYAELHNLDAKALEMAYDNSDLSMLIILPNSRTGLKKLEEQLATVSLSNITSELYSTEVVVKLPKFKAEFKIQLNDVLKKLGMQRMFTGSAELTKMLEEPQPLFVSEVIHKAFIEVNEEGTEAAAATVITMEKFSMILETYFVVNNPFFYAIKTNTGSIIFTGNMKSPK